MPLLPQRDYQDYVDAVIDHPADRNLRRVFADWLEDRDDPRGPILRLSAAAEEAALLVPVGTPAPLVPSLFGPRTAHPVQYSYNPTRWTVYDSPVSCQDRGGWTRILVIALVRDLATGFGGDYVPAYGWITHGLFKFANTDSVVNGRSQFDATAAARSLAVWELYSARLIGTVKRSRAFAHPLSFAYANVDSRTYDLVKHGTYRGYESSIGKLYQIAVNMAGPPPGKYPGRPTGSLARPYSKYLYARWLAAALAFAAAARGFNIGALSRAEREARPARST